MKKLYYIQPDGKIYKIMINAENINTYIEEKLKSLTDEYEIIEKAVKREVENISTSRSYFTGSTIALNPSEFLRQFVGSLGKAYSYYENVYFDEDFFIYNSLKIRLNYKKTFSYLIQDGERMPYFMMKLIKPQVRELAID